MKSKITEPKAPHRVKPTEEGRINPAYINLTEENKLIPQEGIVYLWVYNSNKELIVGIEKPWEHPEAFNINTEDIKEKEIWDRISDQLQTLIEGIQKHFGFGHPTLAAIFDDHGEVNVGLAHLGGELRYEEGEWVIDNKSGRFGRYEEIDPTIQQQVESTFIQVANIFHASGIDVTPKIDFENPKIFSPMYKEESKRLFFKKSLDDRIKNTREAIEKISDNTREAIEKISDKTRKKVEDIAESTISEIEKKI